MRRPRLAFGVVSAATVALLFLSTPAAALDVAVPHVEADHLWDLGYLGQGVEIGVIDLFLASPNHPAISGNHLGSENFANGAAFLGPHATQVTGAAASQDATFRGVAPEAGWWTAQTTNRGTIASLRRQTVAAETFAQGLRGLNGNPVEVITLSIGVGGDGSATDQWSLALDHIVNTNGRTVTVAAGNDGPGGSTVSGSPHGAFNAMIVGATGTTGAAASQDYSNVAVYSSRGPTIDGRSKPDIVAPGSLLHLPGAGGTWSDVNGTSFAAPMVAGAAALLIDMGLDLGYTTDPRVIKSVLLNSADKLTGWTHTPTQPLDHDQGAGQLNLREAHLQYLPGGHDPGTVPDIGWDQHDVAGTAENFYSIDGWIAQGQDVTATLAWDRIVTTDVEDVDDAIYSFDHLDNLDLLLYRSDDLTTAVASSISAVDNVEHLHHAVAAAGAYVLGVRITDGDATDSETYGLTWHTVAGPPGDADRDGDVDDDDLSLLLANWGAAATTDPDGGWARGEFNGLVPIGDDDLSLLLANWTGSPETLAIPEPATLALLAAGIVPLLRGRRRSRSPA